jgi:hypothetical protein
MATDPCDFGSVANWRELSSLDRSYGRVGRSGGAVLGRYRLRGGMGGMGGMRDSGGRYRAGCACSKHVVDLMVALLSAICFSRVKGTSNR